MRLLGVDVGRVRVGLAISDASGTLARPFATLHVSAENGVDQVAREIAKLSAEQDGLAEIVVGLPRRLDGSANEATGYVHAFIEALRTRTDVPIVTIDERLTSREAETRLAVRERDWRKRKAQLDAAAAAVILQDYLDERGRHAGQSGLRGQGPAEP
jgi:putative Holliday junction resolvase